MNFKGQKGFYRGAHLRKIDVISIAPSWSVSDSYYTRRKRASILANVGKKVANIFLLSNDVSVHHFS